jgi:hypothetical protein
MNRKIYKTVLKNSLIQASTLQNNFYGPSIMQKDDHFAKTVLKFDGLVIIPLDTMVSGLSSSSL